MRARMIAGLPADLVGSLTGLTQGHFPVHAKARYADDLAERDARGSAARSAARTTPPSSSTHETTAARSTSTAAAAHR